jgi:hypothetical protein
MDMSFWAMEQLRGSGAASKGLDSCVDLLVRAATTSFARLVSDGTGAPPLTLVVAGFRREAASPTLLLIANCREPGLAFRPPAAEFIAIELKTTRRMLHVDGMTTALS